MSVSVADLVNRYSNLDTTVIPTTGSYAPVISIGDGATDLGQTAEWGEGYLFRRLNL